MDDTLVSSVALDLLRETEMAKILYETTLCVDCMLHHANGECGSCAWCTDETGEVEWGSQGLPLSALEGDESHRLALGAHEHQDNCTEEDRQEGCDCGTNPFWTFTCGGCGRFTSGEAHDAVIFDR